MRRSSSSLLALLLGLGIYGLGPIVTKFELVGATPAEAKAKHTLILSSHSGGGDDDGNDDGGDDNGDDNGNDDGDDNGGDDHDGGGDHHNGGDDHGGDDHGNDGNDDDNDN